MAPPLCLYGTSVFPNRSTVVGRRSDRWDRDRVTRGVFSMVGQFLVLTDLGVFVPEGKRYRQTHDDDVL